MFKKVLLSTLASVFLMMLIFTYATAFAVPNTAPPTGLASPTFGGLTVTGAAGTFNNGLTVNGAVGTFSSGLTSTAGTTNLGTTNVGATGATKNLTVTGTSTLGTTTVGSTAYLGSRDLTVNGNVISTGDITLGGSLQNSLTTPLWIQDNLDVTGNVKVGTSLAKTDLTVSGNATAAKFGHTYRHENSGNGDIATDLAKQIPYGGFKSDSDPCPTGSYVMSCGARVWTASCDVKNSWYLLNASANDVNIVYVFTSDDLATCWTGARWNNPTNPAPSDGCNVGSTNPTNVRFVQAVAICSSPGTTDATSTW